MHAESTTNSDSNVSHGFPLGTKTVPFDHGQINTGPLARFLTILFVKTRNQGVMRKVWRSHSGLLSFSNICVKVKPFEHLAEAHAMRFVAEKLSIPVPKVYCAFTYKGDTYIVMSKIKGHMASRGWDSRSEESKDRLFYQLRQMIQELRSIKPPKTIGVANVDGGPICDYRLPSKPFWGPFGSIRDFHKALVNGANVATEYANMPPNLPELFSFYRTSLDMPTFTHGDLSKSNVLVNGNQIVGIIDWETAGWFPSYWEYTCARSVAVNSFAESDIDKFLEPKRHELRMEHIRRQYCDF